MPFIFDFNSLNHNDEIRELSYLYLWLIAGPSFPLMLGIAVHIYILFLM